MFRRLIRSSISLHKSSFQNFAATSRPSGNLYTWGSSTNSLGYPVPQTTQKVITPTLVSGFNNNVVKAVFGQSHSAVVTAEGDLYTFGTGQQGVLGHNDNDTTHVNPKVVNFFKKNNLRVVDVAIGDQHTVALTDDGDVFSWGQGAKNRGLLLELFLPSFSSLGHGDTKERPIPTPIESLRAHPPTVQVTAGSHFTLALNGKHDLYMFGRGEYAVFGDGNNKNLKVPTLNESITRMRETEGLVIKSIKSCGSQTLALAENGLLYGWGSNEHGQLGVKTEIGIEMYETANYPSKVSSEKLNGKSIIEFDIADNVAVFLTDNNEVYWMGLKLSYEPALLKIPSDEVIKKVGAVHGSVCAVTQNNKIYMKNKFLKEESENIETGVFIGNTEVFGQGSIVDIGGTYRNRFAIVKN